MGHSRRTPEMLLGAMLLLSAASSCGRRTSTDADVSGAIRVRWTTRIVWDGVGGPGGIGKVHRNFLVVGPVDTALNRYRVPCRGAPERLAVHPVNPVIAWRCGADQPWKAEWYDGVNRGLVRLGECLPLGRGARPAWSPTRVSLDRDSARCIAHINRSGASGTTTAYALIEREAGADALADALAALVVMPDHSPSEVEFRAAVGRLGPLQRGQVFAALRVAAMAPGCDPTCAVLASDLRDLAADPALADALVAHLSRFWQPYLPTGPASGWRTPHGAPFKPMLERLTARLSPVRPGPVGQISCAVTRIRVNGRVDQMPEARAAVLRAGIQCPPTPP
nr:hypothetical protein [Deltaproteobacteria bacterium]